MSLMKPLRPLAVAIVSAVLCAQAPLARAELVGTSQLATRSQADQDRATVQSFLDRADVRQKLTALGVGDLAAKDRVAAMSDAEAHMLAQRIDALPAGGYLSDMDLIVVLLIAILVAIAL